MNSTIAIAFSVTFSFCTSALPLMASPLQESDRQCKLWSSLKCMGLGLAGAYSSDPLKLLLENEVLPGTTTSMTEVLYLNGWAVEDLRRPVGEIESDIVWIAYDGFRPEDIDQQPMTYSFANEDCRAQLIELRENMVDCRATTSMFLRLGSFLENNARSHKLVEFIELNGLPTEADAGFTLDNHTFYRMPTYK